MEKSREEQLMEWTEQTLQETVQQLLDRGITDTALVEAKPAWVLPFQILIDLDGYHLLPLWAGKGEGLFVDPKWRLADSDYLSRDVSQ